MPTFDSDAQKERIVDSRKPDFRGFFSELGVEFPSHNSKKYLVRCFVFPWFHDGNHRRSCLIDVSTGRWSCRYCGRHGDALDAATASGKSSVAIQRLVKRYGLSAESEALAPPSAQPVRAENSASETGADLLDDLVEFMRRFVVLADHQAQTVALWVMHTHAFEAAEATPYLLLTSPEKRSGKTRLLEVLALLVAKPWRLTSPTEAVVFRKIEAERPTLLLDEYDAIFAPGRTMEGLRGLLNAGHRPGATVARIVGEGSNMQARDFEVFSPKALAGIGDAPDTIADRSIRIRMKRRAETEECERFRHRWAAEEATPLQNRVAQWAEANLEALKGAVPELPAELDDRAADGWEPLLAIADVAGGTWPALAREAAVSLATGVDREDQSRGIRLLRDIRTIFVRARAERLSSAVLAEKLGSIEDAPWGNIYGRPLDVRGLARRLKAYEIAPKPMRFDKQILNGYERAAFEDAWTRYLPSDERPDEKLGDVGEREHFRLYVNPRTGRPLF